MHAAVVVMLLATGPPAPTPSATPLEGSGPPPPARDALAAWKERDRLLLDGTVTLAVLTTLGVAAMTWGTVLLATAGRDPEHCGGDEGPSCRANSRRFLGVWLVIPGSVLAVPSGIGLGFVAHRWQLHRNTRPATLGLGPGSLTLRF